MKTLIVYYSLEGNVQYAAEQIAKNIKNAELLRLIPKKAYPDSGFKKFLWGGKAAVMKEVPELEPFTVDFSDIERVVIATPVWASTFAPPIRTFIRKYLPELSGKKIAVAASSAGGNAKKCIEDIKKEIPNAKIDATVSLIDPKNKPEYNQKLIDEFCKSLA